MYPLATEESLCTATLPAVQADDTASRTDARLLITASTPRKVETLARQIHDAGVRATLPFVQTRARDLPMGADALREHCSGFLDSAAGGSLLMTDVEEMPPAVQTVLLELLATLEFAGPPSTAVRLISGTSVSLLDCVTAGTFSDRLFYRLNIIHLVQRDWPHARQTPTLLQ